MPCALCAAADGWLANPALPADILKEAVPGNIRRAEHFLAFLRRLVHYLGARLKGKEVETEGPLAFLAALGKETGIEAKSLRFCYDRLQSLMLTLEVAEVDEFSPLNCLCDFATLVGTYSKGFAIIMEPYDERMPHIADPVLQVRLQAPAVALPYPLPLGQLVRKTPRGAHMQASCCARLVGSLCLLLSAGLSMLAPAWWPLSAGFCLLAAAELPGRVPGSEANV